MSLATLLIYLFIGFLLGLFLDLYISVLKLYFSLLCQGHELVLHILYHLQSLMISSSNENSSYVAAVYEKLLLAVVGTDSAISTSFLFH